MMSHAAEVASQQPASLLRGLEAEWVIPPGLFASPAGLFGAASPSSPGPYDPSLSASFKRRYASRHSANRRRIAGNAAEIPCSEMTRLAYAEQDSS